MLVTDAIAHILKAEAVQYLFAYPVNPIIDAAAKVGIRPIIVRQERTGLHMADALSRVSSGRRIGVFCMQNGPGSENAFGGVAQAYADAVPLVVLPMGNPRDEAHVPPNFDSALNFRHITKSCEQVTLPEAVPQALRRAFTQAVNGRPGPALVELPKDLLESEFPGTLEYRPTSTYRCGPDPEAVRQAAKVLLEAQRPLLYVGQGVHYARAWEPLRDLAELLEVPVMTSLCGKSAFPENHPLALGSGGRSVPATVHHFLQHADVICGIGCSFSITIFGVDIPKGKTIIHATLDPADVNKDVVADYALIGDADLTTKALLEEIRNTSGGKPRGRASKVAEEIQSIKQPWLAQWEPKLTHGGPPLSPYRVIRDLMNTVDIDNTIITHDSGSPRDQLVPFWESTTPLSYIGWGKSTQLGYGLGLAMGAKLACPDKLCINVWGDAAIGFTGMDLETAVRERIPILSILFNNFCMAIELNVMPYSTEKYRSTDISGDYAAMARAFGAYGERIEQPDQIIPAIQRGIEQTQKGVPALLEFITVKENEYSMY
jgi:thiamine pyrophosphate-dependent acetolactate synthase large subunit-like protein